MKQIIFCTGNDHKFVSAQHTCAKYGIEIIQNKIETTEIQEEDSKKVAIDKADKAFAAVGKPLVITDDSWSFEGLGGFPGVYMHSMNRWLTAEDFLRLVLPLQNRTVTVTQHLIYTDGKIQKVFTKKSAGTLLTEIRGTSAYPSHMIVAMDGDNGLSVAEAYDTISDKSTRKTAQVWHDFGQWYQDFSKD